MQHTFLSLILGILVGASSAQATLCPKFIIEDNLNDIELARMVQATLGVDATRPRVLFLTDLPLVAEGPESVWTQRTGFVADWASRLKGQLPYLQVGIVAYPDTGRNNGPLPTHGCRYFPGEALPTVWSPCAPERSVEIIPAVDSVHTVIALNNWSATRFLRERSRHSIQTGAPLLRAASMPGFHWGMVQGLRVDFDRVETDAVHMKRLLEAAVSADVEFEVREPLQQAKHHTLHVDLRHHHARHDSGKVLDIDLGKDEPVTNLPGGEAWKCPYEGRLAGDPSRTRGVLPVQMGNELVLFRVEQNRIQEVLSQGPESGRMRAKFALEPLLGNIAEFGLGVLALQGVETSRLAGPGISNTLLHEKLTLHIAYGINGYLGGAVNDTEFNDPTRAEHTDFVYHAKSQPWVTAKKVVLTFANLQRVTLILDGNYVAPLPVPPVE